MSALIVRLAPVRNAVDSSQRMGVPETRQQVIDRVLADIRAGHHPYVLTASDTAFFHDRRQATFDRFDGAA